MKSYIKIPMRKIRSHKRHFQLLELMVAVFILLICVAPTMRIFTSMYQSQQEIIRENQRDHLAHLIHAKITEMLYKRQIHISEGDSEILISLSDPELNDELKKFSYTFEANTIIEPYKPRGREHPSHYLAHLVIKLKDVSPKVQKKEKTFENQDSADTFYDYKIYIDAGKKAEKDDKKNGNDTKKNEDDMKNEDDLEDDAEDEDVTDDDKKKDSYGKMKSNSSNARKKAPSTRPRSPLANLKKESE